MVTKDKPRKRLDRATGSTVGATVFGLIAAIIVLFYLFRYFVQHWL
ncbi:hypothetical protein [Alicyclobacillus dauci]|uniref:Uncharacterized protein n=1 Tax=Alicyclobacillus dauci TaxID=1475485 RepID=A0ABY6Z601_9BACL|nr:hypothetical protein [Alicyclobacillus dauci]WAH38295.1 hypothetical protein NZD86_07375 [Alicyclobacillus dauci]